MKSTEKDQLSQTHALYIIYLTQKTKTLEFLHDGPLIYPELLVTNNCIFFPLSLPSLPPPLSLSARCLRRNLAKHQYAKVYQTQEDMCRKRNEIRIANMQLVAIKAQVSPLSTYSLPTCSLSTYSSPAAIKAQVSTLVLCPPVLCLPVNVLLRLQSKSR